jgi:hypothetical protein
MHIEIVNDSFYDKEENEEVPYIDSIITKESRDAYMVKLAVEMKEKIDEEIRQNLINSYKK